MAAMSRKFYYGGNIIQWCIILNCGGPEFNCDGAPRKTVHDETRFYICYLSRARIVIRKAQVGPQMYTLDGDVKKKLNR